MYHWSWCPDCGMMEAQYGGDPCQCGGTFSCEVFADYGECGDGCTA
jgi:hypothetical protein